MSLKEVKLLITIVPRDKKSLFLELIRDFDVNVQLHTLGVGSASSKLLDTLGFEDDLKTIIISFVKKDDIKDCILRLEDKFLQGKSYQGISFSLPIESIIGVSTYTYLANLKKELK